MCRFVGSGCKTHCLSSGKWSTSNTSNRWGTSECFDKSSRSYEYSPGGKRRCLQVYQPILDLLCLLRSLVKHVPVSCEFTVWDRVRTYARACGQARKMNRSGVYVHGRVYQHFLIRKCYEGGFSKDFYPDKPVRAR